MLQTLRTHWRNPTTARRAGWLCLALILVCNEWVLTGLFSPDGLLSMRNVVLIWVFDVLLVLVGLVLVLSRSFARLFDLFMGLGFTLLLIFGAEKFYGRLNNVPPPVDAPPPPPPVHHEGDYTQDFFRPDDLLGYTVKPDAQITSIKKAGDDIIYDVTYTLDAHHRRLTPVDNPAARDKFLLFFGDSFTFGEGVADDETLPFYVAQQATTYQPYNYGLSGYGPQQMLAKLQSDTLPQEVNEATGAAIYIFIDAHVERAIGSMYVYNAWGDQMPFYTTTWGGDLVRRGNFKTGRPLVSALYELLAQSEIARYYQLNIPGTLRPAHYQQAARIIIAARDTFQQTYQSDQFYVVIYPDEGDYFEDIIPYFEAANLNILNYDEFMKLDPDQGLSIAGDGHPTGKANQIVAEKIVVDAGLASE